MSSPSDVQLEPIAGRTPARVPKPRGRLSRTLSRGRWGEYRTLLATARDAGYELVSLEDFLVAPQRWADTRALLLRHDVDQHPHAALRLAAVEREFGATSTWYFRWRTAHPEVIAELRRHGAAVGLHYETLSRQVRARGTTPAGELERLRVGARHVLRGEIAAFAARFGPIRSVCPHGDSAMPAVSNASLLLGEDWSSYGIVADAHLGMRLQTLGAWVTDRPHGGWSTPEHPHELLAAGVTPILCLVHPNNWASQLSLRRDQLLRLALRTPGWDRDVSSRPIRTGTDRPPI